MFDNQGLSLHCQWYILYYSCLFFFFFFSAPEDLVVADTEAQTRIIQQKLRWSSHFCSHWCFRACSDQPTGSIRGIKSTEIEARVLWVSKLLRGQSPEGEETDHWSQENSDNPIKPPVNWKAKQVNFQTKQGWEAGLIQEFLFSAPYSCSLIWNLSCLPMQLSYFIFKPVISRPLPWPTSGL